jgi:hypothetical protein
MNMVMPKRLFTGPKTGGNALEAEWAAMDGIIFCLTGFASGASFRVAPWSLGAAAAWGERAVRAGSLQTPGRFYQQA